MRFVAALRERCYPGRLSELRKKDPEIAQAALFVEGIFGRPLRNDPRVVNIAFFPCVTRGGGYISLPNGLEHPIFPKSLRRGSLSVHEIVHSEDIALERQKGDFNGVFRRLTRILDIRQRIIQEGRAIFAQQIHNGKINRFEKHFAILAASIVGAVLDLAGGPQFLSRPEYTIGIVIGLLYWLFHNALCTLAGKVGDPIKAFRITTGTPPSLMAILFPARHYKDEIEAARSTNLDCPVIRSNGNQ